jgi:DNA-binding response OmpR family regulator
VTEVRILLVEDNPELAEELADHLRFYGFSVDLAGCIESMRQRLAEQAFNLLLLDLGMPDGDALKVIDWLREQFGQGLGIIIISARGEVEDRVAAISAGADSYLVKPINLREMRALINRLAERVAGNSRRAAAFAAGWRLDETSRQLHVPGSDIAVGLTGAQLQLLRCLLRRAGEVVTREDLCQEIYLSRQPIDTRRLDSLVSRLRRRVESATGQTLPVHTFRNVGYMFPDKGQS